MATFSQWVQGARPRTLPAAVAPVLIGTGAAVELGEPDAAVAFLALLVAVALQVGVNYANDYSDGIRGTDSVRVGPGRLVAGGLTPARNVKFAAVLAFSAAAVIGLALVALSQAWLLLPVGVAAIAAGWFYTGGRRPYGYAGLGELAVFVFFGLVATLGTTYAQADALSTGAAAGAVGVGALSCALLTANNLRDIPGDSRTGKRTLAVRLGDRSTRWLYAGLILVGLLAAVGAAWATCWLAAAGAVAFVLAWPPLAQVLGLGRERAQGMALVPVLEGTARLALAYGALLGLGLAFC